MNPTAAETYKLRERLYDALQAHKAFFHLAPDQPSMSPFCLVPGWDWLGTIFLRLVMVGLFY